MIAEYKSFISIIYCVCLSASIIFYALAMRADDGNEIGIWGAAVSFLATFVSGLVLAILALLK